MSYEHNFDALFTSEDDTPIKMLPELWVKQDKAITAMRKFNAFKISKIVKQGGSKIGQKWIAQKIYNDFEKYTKTKGGKVVASRVKRLRHIADKNVWDYRCADLMEENASQTARWSDQPPVGDPDVVRKCAPRQGRNFFKHARVECSVDRAWKYGRDGGNGVPVDCWWYEQCDRLPWLAPSGMTFATYKKKMEKKGYAV